MKIKSYLLSDAGAAPLAQSIIREQGIAKGKAECILDTLSDYGSVPLGIQERILCQTNCSQLDRWFSLARQVRSVEEFTNRM